MNRISTGIMLAKRKLPRCSRNRWKIELVAEDHVLLSVRRMPDDI
jgi:hypothetical protein